MQSQVFGLTPDRASGSVLAIPRGSGVSWSHPGHIQNQFERESDAANKAQRKAFAQAQKEGLTLREIGEEVGLHHTRVGQIIRGE